MLEPTLVGGRDRSAMLDRLEGVRRAVTAFFRDERHAADEQGDAGENEGATRDDRRKRSPASRRESPQQPRTRRPPGPRTTSRPERQPEAEAGEDDVRGASRSPVPAENSSPRRIRRRGRRRASRPRTRRRSTTRALPRRQSGHKERGRARDARTRARARTRQRRASRNHGSGSRRRRKRCAEGNVVARITTLPALGVVARRLQRLELAGSATAGPGVHPAALPRARGSHSSSRHGRWGRPAARRRT